jgi:tRNA(Ile)-lysidine synthase
MPGNLHDPVLAYIRRHELLRAGDRLGLAVSGGADSTALLRVLLQLRGELGVPLSVIHFNHRIRGAAADADEQFVAALAERFELPFHRASGDVPAHAAAQGLSLETAARELRYRFFKELLRAGTVNKIATAHTLDDQAETVLLRLLRGAGTRGLAGIHPKLSVAGCQLSEASAIGHRPTADSRQPTTDDQRPTTSAVIRPLLDIRRSEIEAYLRGLGQDWCEDATNRDVKYLRNRVRHVLLPLLERQFNPAIRQVLADTAEVARAEEEYWKDRLTRLETGPAGQEPGDTISTRSLDGQPLAVRRRLVRARAQRLGINLEFEHVEKILALAGMAAGNIIELPGGWVAERRYECVPAASGQGAVSRAAVVELRRASASGPYEYPLPVPGEVRVEQLGAVVRASAICRGGEGGSYNRNQLLDPLSLSPDLRLRNWRPGDRYWPAHSKSVRKVKELLQTRHISGPERSLWPVVVNSADELVWMRGFPPPQRYAAAPDAEAAILIEVLAGEEEGCGA